MPSPVPSCGPSQRKNGTSAPTSAAMRVQLVARERRRERRVREHERGRGIRAAAAETGGDGDPLLDAHAPARVDAGRLREPPRALAGRACPPRNPRRSELSAGSSSMSSQRSIGLQDGGDLVLPVGTKRADDEREVDLRERARARHRKRRGEGDELVRRELLGANARRLADLPRALARRRARVTRPASASEFASVFRRCAKAAFTTGRTVGERRTGDALERDERGVDARPRPEHRRRRPGGSRPCACCELHEDGDGAVRLRPRRRRRTDRRPRAAPSRTSARARGCRRGSPRRAASRCCTGGSRRASSAAARATPRSSASASPKTSRTLSRPSSADPERLLERAVELDRMHEARRARRGSG